MSWHICFWPGSCFGFPFSSSAPRCTFLASRSLSPIPQLCLLLLHIFGNTNFGIFNEFQVVVIVVAIPLSVPSSCPLAVAYFCVFLRLRWILCNVCCARSPVFRVLCPVSRVLCVLHACGCGNSRHMLTSHPHLPHDLLPLLPTMSSCWLFFGRGTQLARLSSKVFSLVVRPPQLFFSTLELLIAKSFRQQQQMHFFNAIQRRGRHKLHSSETFVWIYFEEQIVIVKLVILDR